MVRHGDLIDRDDVLRIMRNTFEKMGGANGDPFNAGFETAMIILKSHMVVVPRDDEENAQ